MSIEAFAKQNCSIAKPLSILGERWTILVLREISLGNRRFDEIQRELGVATNVLSARLATLTDEEIVERRAYSEHPKRFEYRLTKKGADLQPILLAFLRWGDTYTAGKAGPPLETVHATCDHVFHMVPTCSHCGEEVKSQDLRPRPGPGATKRQRDRHEQARLRHEAAAASARPT
jgi:DNA-binding HxlR family transcriptional regulator